MILIDSSAFIATCDKSEGDHLRCVENLKNLIKIKSKLIATLPCITEAMYFLHKQFGWKGQELLWKLIENNSFEFHSPDSSERSMMHWLMHKYKDTPMDFADASLVAAAETLATNRIFTLDGDFTVYRINGRKSFEIIPEIYQ